jgi:hypothetical protein
VSATCPPARWSDLSAEIAEQEGLVSRLCMPETIDGQLRWREGAWEASERLFLDANEIAQDGGWVEVSIRALMGLSATLRDSGDLGSAEGALVDALAVCERSGFVPRAVQVHSALALTRMLAGRREPAREAAAQALALGERVRDPINEAAALEAKGIVGEPPDAFAALRDARALWEKLGRPLDAARCVMLLGRRLAEQEPQAASAMLTDATRWFDELGVTHLSAQSRELALQAGGG